jgi:hypothetical protein
VSPRLITNRRAEDDDGTLACGPSFAVEMATTQSSPRAIAAIRFRRGDKTEVVIDEVGSIPHRNRLGMEPAPRSRSRAPNGPPLFVPLPSDRGGVDRKCKEAKAGEPPHGAELKALALVLLRRG